MGLMMPPPRGLVGSITNLASNPANYSSRATVVTSSGSANTKGSWTQLIAAASVTAPVIGISVSIANNLTTATAVRSFFDIGVGGSGSEQVLISNISFIGPSNAPNQPGPAEVFIPVRIPAGTRISCRHASTSTSKASNVLITVYFGNWADHRTFAGAECINADTSTTSMTAATAGNSGSYGSWFSVGSTTGRTYYGASIMVQNNTVTVLTAMSYVADWGWNSTARGSRWFSTQTTEAEGSFSGPSFDYGVIPVGTQLQMRGKASATAESLQYGIMCLY
jgi:hypothetical protein